MAGNGGDVYVLDHRLNAGMGKAAQELDLHDRKVGQSVLPAPSRPSCPRALVRACAPSALGLR